MPPRAPVIRHYALVPDEGFAELRSVRDIPPGITVGRRVAVSDMAGAGKNTFSRALSAKTGLPVIHLDVHHLKRCLREEHISVLSKGQNHTPTLSHPDTEAVPWALTNG